MQEKITLTMERQGLTMDVNRADFAVALKTWRVRNGLTQRQVAKTLGTSRYTIIRAENGKNISWESAYMLFCNLAKELRKEGLENVKP